MQRVNSFHLVKSSVRLALILPLLYIVRLCNIYKYILIIFNVFKGYAVNIKKVNSRH